MIIAKQYSHETILMAKEFINKKGRHLAYLLEKKKGAEIEGYKQEARSLEEEIISLRRRIARARSITFGL